MNVLYKRKEEHPTSSLSILREWEERGVTTSII